LEGEQTRWPSWTTSPPSCRPWAGIQPRRVRAVKRLFALKDVIALDPGPRPLLSGLNFGTRCIALFLIGFRRFAAFWTPNWS